MTESKYEELRLGDLVSRLESGVSVRADSAPPAAGEVGVLKVSCLTGGRFDATESKRVPTGQILSLASPVRKGRVIISRSNTPELVGLCAYVSVDHPNLFLPDTLWQMEFSEERESDPRWLAYLLSSPAYREQLSRNASGTSANMKKLQKSSLLRMKIRVPPLPEQRKIAAILRTWDEAIEKLEALRAAKLRLLHYKYATIFHPGLSANSGWPERRIGDFVNPRVEKALPSEEMPLYSLTIEDGITPKTERYNRDFLVKDRDAKTYKIVHPGDIVFNPANLRWGAIARSYVSHPVVVSPIYEVLEINSNKIDLDYLNHALTCPYQIRRFATKVEGTLVERMAVKLDTFLMTKILVPNDREEQVRFSGMFNTMETEIRTLSRQKALIERQKRGLMQKLLTGEWRVTP